MGKIKSHKKEIESLKTKDPDFYKFLQENDTQILNFGENEDDDEGEEDDEVVGDLNENDDDQDFEVMDYDDNENETEEYLEDMEDEELEEEIQPKKKSSGNVATGSIEITNEMLDESIEKSIDPTCNTFTSLKKLLGYFRAACAPNSDNDDNEEEDNDSNITKNKYVVTSPDVYNNIMIKVLENAHIAFKILFQSSDNDNRNEEYDFHKMEQHNKWKKYQTLITGFFKSISKALTTFQYLTDQNAEQSGPIGVFLISSLSEYIFLLSNLPRLARTILKLLLMIWSQDLAINLDVSKIRENAFLRIFQMAKVLPEIIAEDVFRQVYLVYAKKCRSYNEVNSPSVLFMMECFVQLYSINIGQAYQQGFVYIRQLALHLRSYILKKGSTVNNEHAKVVYSWQYLNCLKLWTKLLCAAPAENQLGALIFPLTQVILGFLSTIQSSYYLPLKFHLIACLHQLAAAGEVFIPTAARLFEVFDIADLMARSQGSTAAAPDIRFMLKLPTNSLNTQVMKDFIITETISLLQTESEIYKYHVSYPEYVFMIVRKLKTFSKTISNNKVNRIHVSKWKDCTKALIAQMEEQSVWVKKKRLELKKSPVEITEFEPLLPLSATSDAKAIIRVNRIMNLKFNNQSAGAGKNQSANNSTKSSSANLKRKGNEYDDDDDEVDERPRIKNHKNSKKAAATATVSKKSNEQPVRATKKATKKKEQSAGSTSADAGGDDLVGEFTWFNEE